MTVEMLRPVFARAFKYWSEDQVPRYAAALTFYFLLAISPLLLFIVAASSLLLQTHGNANELQRQLLETINHTMGSSQADFFKQIIDSSRSKGAGYLATSVGLIVTLFGASGLFQQLQSSMNSIWRTHPKSTGWKAAVMSKVVAVLMVLAVGIILLGWLAFDAWLRIVRHTIGEQGGFPVRQMISFLFSWAFWCPIYAGMFKWIPERKLEWRDVWLAGIVTALAFAITKYLLAIYFSYSSVSVTYGSAGAIVVILLWAYYSAQIFFYGVEMSRSYAELYGSLKGQDVAEEAEREDLAALASKHKAQIKPA